MGQKTADEYDDDEGEERGRDTVPSVVGFNVGPRGVSSSDEPSALTAASSQVDEDFKEDNSQFVRRPVSAVARGNAQRVSSDMSPHGSNCRALHFKDQVQSVIEPQAIMSGTYLEYGDHRGSELVVGDADVDVDVEEGRGSMADNSAVNSPSVLIHGQSVIPMAEAFVIAGSNNDLDTMQPRVIEPHIVQIEDSQSITTFHAGGSRTTRTTDPTFCDRSNEAYGTEHSSDDNYNDRPHEHNNNDSRRSSCNNNSSKDMSKQVQDAAAAAVLSERRFWIRIIFLAIALNSILVAGVVVGGFCGSGKCSSTKEVSPKSTEIGTSDSTAAPTSISRKTSIPSPESTPIDKDNQEPELEMGITTIPDEMEDDANTGLMPPLLPDVVLSMPPSDQTFYPQIDVGGVHKTKPPCLYDCFDTAVTGGGAQRNETGDLENEEDNTGSRNDINGTDSVGTTEISSPSDGVSIGVLIAIAVAFEAIIVYALYVYSRRWRSKRSAQAQKLDQVTPGSRNVDYSSS